jgi:hypothetical protein
MARPTIASGGPLEPSQWPDWVLAFPGGYYPDDPERQAESMRAYHAWRRERAQWFATNGVPFSWRACHEEHRRRAERLTEATDPHH